jgi:hypothetical protein
MRHQFLITDFASNASASHFSIVDLLIMTSRNVRSLSFTLVHERSASSYIDLTNLMCVRCTKRLTSNSRHICVFRSNKRKCQYCHDQRHKCHFVDLLMRWSCDALLTVLNVAIFLRYDFDAQDRRRSSRTRSIDAQFARCSLEWDRLRDELRSKSISVSRSITLKIEISFWRRWWFRRLELMIFLRVT